MENAQDLEIREIVDKPKSVLYIANRSLASMKYCSETIQLAVDETNYLAITFD